MDKPYSCSECNTSFTRRYNLARHNESYHPELHDGESNDSESMSDSEKPYPCLDCNAAFTSSYNLRRHEKRKHEAKSINDDDDDNESGNEDDDNESDYEDDDNESDREDDDNESNDDTDSYHDDDDEADASDNDNESDKMSVSSDSDEEEDESFDALQRVVISVLNDHSDEFHALLESYQDTDLTPKEAACKAFKALLPVYKKSLKRYVVNYITLSSKLRRTPLFNSIFRKIKRLEDDGLDEEEAIQSAVSYRKYSIYDLLQSYMNDYLRNIETEEDH